jgi:DNA polymerase-3 subunit alpha
MQSACKQVGVSNIDDINAICALYRPGPMAFIPDSSRRGKRDPASVHYPAPAAGAIARRRPTASSSIRSRSWSARKIIAGYTLGGADMLRRAMGKKDADAMAKERVKFVEGAPAHQQHRRKAGQ